MGERGIIMTGESVRAILAGRKRQTRRLVRFPTWAAGCFDDPLKVEVETDEAGRDPEVICNDTGCLAALPLPFAVGDRLWVRESHQINAFGSHPNWTAEHVIYAADDACVEMQPPVSFVGKCDIGLRGWRSPIHMLRWASRLTLTVTDVRVQRLQDISEEDAVAEGIRLMRDGGGTFVGREGPGRVVTPWPTAAEAYLDVWDGIHGHQASDANPWVAAITFEVTTPSSRDPGAGATSTGEG